MYKSTSGRSSLLSSGTSYTRSAPLTLYKARQLAHCNVAARFNNAGWNAMKKEDQILPDARGGGGRPRTRKINAARLLVAGAIGLLLYYAHTAFIPIALALLLALV